MTALDGLETQKNGISDYSYPLVLSTQMTLLRSSTDILYVGTQKDMLGLKFSKTLQMGMTWDAFTLEPACHIIFISVEQTFGDAHFATY